MKKRRMACECGNIDGMTRIPNSHAHVGIITEFHDNGVFKNNRALYLENNYCPQCGKAYNIQDRQISMQKYL